MPSNADLAARLHKIADQLGHLPSSRYDFLLDTGLYQQKGRLLILEKYHEEGQNGLRGRAMVKTICSCGVESIFPATYVNRNAIRDCGHVKKDKELQRELQLPKRVRVRLTNNRKDYTDSIVGLLLITGHHTNVYDEIIWRAECACGKKIELDLHKVHKSTSDKARYKNKRMTCGAHICEGLSSKGFTREQALEVLRELKLRNVSR